MSSPLIHEIKRQASHFFKEKIKSARLVLTDVTPIELITEEATNGNPWPPDTRIMQVISRAAFEVDEYYRIVEILHSRLLKFNKGYWRASYKALILLEHLLTHGPLRLFEEFQCDIDVIEEIGEFQYIDEKGFNWGLSVRKLSERILKLLRSNEFYKEERARARELSRGIKGFGSFNRQSSVIDEGMNDLNSKIYGRCNSNYDHHQHEEYDFASFGKKKNVSDGNKRDNQVHENKESIKLQEDNPKLGEEDNKREHPFIIDQEKITSESLLSIVQ
ncbi:hypothetical protein PIB30_002829 [Stylosanthes scabra]|uniref:ENTH domain-containing protein n=1 Tax=Stylosanthes scabra TaxID=79078 RepID=A0ABU6T425_9FABA|nr:hypothetical protein [Stylosanthes scabra]